LALTQAVRQVCFKSCPNFGFDRDKIEINENTSIQHNDYIRDRISHFPVQFPPDFMFNYLELIKPCLNRGHPLYNLIVKGMNKSPNSRESDIRNVLEQYYEKQIVWDSSGTSELDLRNMILNFRLDIEAKDQDELTELGEYLDVTTSHCKWFWNNVEIENPYPRPLLISRLRKGQKLKMTAQTILDIPASHPSFSIVRNCWFTHTNKNIDLEVILKSNLDIRQVMRAILHIIQTKADNLNYVLHKKIQLDPKIEFSGILEIANDRYCMTNLFVDLLQDHSNIEFAGYTVPQMLENNSEIAFRTDQDTSILDIMNDILHTLDQRIIKFYHDLKLDELDGLDGAELN
jgi:DNA-directed RNA polymerase subunit L